MISWTLFLQIYLLILFIALLVTKQGRKAIEQSSAKFLQILTSKRFLTLMIATWFVYREIKIDPNWLLLAGFFIGLDTVNNNGVFSAFAEYLRNKKVKVPDNG